MRQSLFPIVALAVAAACLLVIMARRAADAAATSDTAVIESYTLLASQGALALGAYSRFQWHHPGPLSFFWMVPFYVLSGFRTTGLNAGALALNVTSLVVIALVVCRRSGGALSIAICAALFIYLWRTAEVLASPWSPHVAVVPMMALMVTAADVLSGSAFMLPVVAAFASLVGQTYVGLLPAAIAIGAVASVGAAFSGRAPERAPSRSFGRWALTTAVVVLVLWLAPLLEQFSGRPGNLTELWTFFVTEAPSGQTFSNAVSAWSDMLSGVARPDFYVAHGWSFRESPVRWAEALALVQLVGLLVCGALAFRARRRFELALAFFLTLASLSALWSATRIDEAIYDHSVFWMSGVGVLNMALIAVPLARFVADRADRSSFDATQENTEPSGGVTTGPQVSTVAISGAVCWAFVALTALVGVQQLREAVRHSADPGAESTMTKAVADDLRTYLEEHRIGRPLIRIDQDAWAIAAGVILQLQKSGVPVAVEDDWIAMFTPVFAANGREAATLTVAGKAQHVRMMDVPGDTVVVAHDPIYVHLAPTASR